MTRRPSIVLAVLGALALAAGLAASANETSSTPSITNAGPNGLRVLHTWLTESGFDVQPMNDSPTDVPVTARTLAIAAPTARRISQREVDALARFVMAGGTLVYLAPRGGAQPLMAEWLGLGGGAFPSAEVTAEDPTGMTARTMLAEGLARGTNAFRLSAERTVTMSDAAPVTEPASLWFKPLGDGEVWVAAGADLAENARLDQLDNSRFWRTLAARGPIAFDEFHHLAESAPETSTTLWALGLQFLFCATLFVWARGRRLGPPRPTAVSAHRASVEYVQAMAALLQHANVDAEVVTAIHAHARTLAAERFGLAPTLAPDELARALSERAALPPEVTRALFQGTQLVPVSV
ncbi:MAG: DUF4350 domain-containing protein, partial [Archangium sp.]|nr:DUF4350 domain-containing protein [Archangium sp.]